MTPLVLLRFWKEGLIAALAVAFMVACHARDNALQARALADERRRQADSILTSLKPQEAKAETLFVRDTIRLTRRFAQFDTIRDTVLHHLTDTVVVKQFITRADSLAQACTELAKDCATKIRLAERRAEILQQLLHEQQPVKIATSCVQSNVIVGVIGAAVGYLAHR